MPIFEYICKECKSEFEVLVYGKEEVECEKCGSKNLEKKFSVFATTSNTNIPSCAESGMCQSGVCPSMPTCPGGSCGL